MSVVVCHWKRVMWSGLVRASEGLDEDAMRFKRSWSSSIHWRSAKHGGLVLCSTGALKGGLVCGARRW